MSLVKQLSSQAGDRTEQSNLRVAEQCLIEPRFIGEIVESLTQKDAALVGDCAEVLTMIAAEAPNLVAPHAQALVVLLGHKNTRVRWEAMHALALTATLIPEVLVPLLPRLEETILNDTSVIVRDYAVDAAGNVALTNVSAARTAYPILVHSLSAWEGKHASHALNGLRHVASVEPDLREEIAAIGIRYQGHERPVIRKAAKALLGDLKP
ncbi:MAG: hypothetical protein BWY63_00123 [Chloroflexi bacterium ADurb.Bin360]|nr:MAG: hypothetical protein BWY63_00123 [Chloroflexi bacterium ADurb.Bin360]